ncbi:MAG: serine hydrolase [Chthoniobacterales bacterium]|nr:MAG: serine hydrolase [Chthoniobacterales bacterium]
MGAKTPTAPGRGAHSLTKEDADAWLDGLIPTSLQRGDVAGAVVVVVKDGAVLLAKGYGYSDVAAHKPVDPDRTLLRPGSVSKLFVWTAVMQQVEQGKLDLDADVNTYLDFQIPSFHDKAMTLRDLMTHTGGFDEDGRALIVTKPKDLHSLEETLKRWIPPLVTAPGSTPAYSNYGCSLAAYIVQRVSGELFDDYVERHIFGPLDMKYSTFRQPVPERLLPFLANVYKLASGEPQPFEIVTLAPVGALSASGGDMGRFMIAHLQKGAFESNRILQEATAVKMHGTPRDMIAPLNRMLLGFYENNINGHRVISHAGDMQFSHAELSLFVDDGVGLYICTNSLGKEGAGAFIRSILFREFSDRYFPGSWPEGTVDAKTAKADAALVAGRYLFTRRSHESFFSITDLLGQIKVVREKDSISVPAIKGLDGQAKKWKEIAPFVWRNVEGGDRIAAKVENGRVLRIGYDPYPFMLLEPVSGLLLAGWLLPLWVVSLVVLVLAALAWPLSALIRRHYGTPYGLTGRDARAHRLVRLDALVVLATMLVWLVLLTLMQKSFTWTEPSMDGWIVALRLLSPVVFIAGAAIALWNTWVVLGSQRRRWAKLWSVVLAIACLVMLYVGIVFHLTGYSANY